MLANSGWRGEEELEKAVESIKTRHTAYLQEMDERHEKINAENNQKREQRRASMRLASMNASIGNSEPMKIRSPNQPSVMRELFPDPKPPAPIEQNSMPSVQVQHPIAHVPQPNPIQHTVQSMQRPVPPMPQSVPQFNQNPIQPIQRPVPPLPQPGQGSIPHMAQSIQRPVPPLPQLSQNPIQRPVQNVPQPFQQQDMPNYSVKGTVKEPELIDVDADVEILSFKRTPEKVQMPVGGQKKEQVIPMEVEVVSNQPRAEVMPVALSNGHVLNNIQGFFGSVAGKGFSKSDMEELSQIISSLADAYRNLDVFIKSKN